MLAALLASLALAPPLPAAPPPPAALQNPWPPAWEREFQERGRRILAVMAAHRANPGNTDFENEKRCGPRRRPVWTG